MLVEYILRIAELTTYFETHRCDSCVNQNCCCFCLRWVIYIRLLNRFPTVFEPMHAKDLIPRRQCVIFGKY